MADNPYRSPGVQPQEEPARRNWRIFDVLLFLLGVVALMHVAATLLALLIWWWFPQHH